MTIKRVATITLNPAYDLVGFCPKVELGDVNLVRTEGLHAAGKGINVAKVLADLGTTIITSGFLGHENRDGFNLLFEQLNIDDHVHTVNGRTRINVKLTEQNSDVTDLNFSGFTVDSNDWQCFIDSTNSWLNQVDMVAISGSLPQGVSLSQLSALISHIKSVCPRVVFDSSREALTAGIKTVPWLIKPNDKELEMWAGRQLSSLNEIQSVAKELVEIGIEHVIVSLGSKGALWVSRHESWLAKPPKCKVISTVGAGDSMVAGLIYGLLNDKSIKETFVLASAIAALSVSQSNVGIKDRNALSEMLNKIEITAV